MTDWPNNELRPQIRDYGTLEDITGHFDLTVPGGVARSAVMLLVVSPVANPGGSTPADALGLKGSTTSGGEHLAGAESSTPGGEVAGATGSGGGGSGGGGGAGGGHGGGRLPFTGFPVVVMASIGAMMAGAGAIIRAKLKRS